VLEVDRMADEPGSSVTLENTVLFANTGDEVKVGTPVLPGAKLELEVREHFRGEKLTIFKMKRRKRYRRKTGHRQELTRVAVKGIQLG
jgi:large subunit ribosomal protein L21